MPKPRKRKLPSTTSLVAVSSDLEPEQAQPSAKKRTKGRRKQETEKASFGTLPLDVVCEIARADFEAAWLLSRLNKTCWRLLTSKKMEKLWDNARANSDLPVVAKFATGAGSKKTKKMRPSLLQVAQLLFGLHCMICGSSRSVHQVIHWGLYTRACSPCAKKHILRDGSLGRAPVMRSSFDPYTGLPLNPWDWNHNGYIFKEDLPICRWTAKDATSAEAADLAAYQTAEAAWMAWANARVNARRNGLQTHFTALGWTDAHFARLSWRSHSLVNVHRAVPADKREQILKTLEQFLKKEKLIMQKEKRARKAKLAKEKIVADRKARHQHVVHCHLALLKDAEAREAAGLDFLPCAAEFLELDSVKRLWYSERSKLDLKGTLEPHYPSIAAEVNRAERGLRAALFDKSVSTLRRETTVANKTPPDGNIPPSSLLPTLPAPLGDKSTFTSAQKDEILSRATTLFSCQGRLGSWRSLFDHDCPVAFDRSLKVRNYSLCPLNLQGAAVVVQAAGKNIDTATAEEMDALGIAFTCESCRSATDENLSVPWTQMVRHVVQCHDPPAEDIKVVCEPVPAGPWPAAVERLINFRVKQFN